MDLSIIIVNWNSIEYLQECIASVCEFTHGILFEIIVVDNASSDDFGYFSEIFPQVKLIKSSRNLGFAKANNLGFAYASGDCLLFLNPDTQLTGPAVNQMYEYLKVLPKPGVIGCKLLNTDLSVQTSCIQRFPTIQNQVLDVQYLQEFWPRSRLWGIAPLFADAAPPTAVEVISGACMMLKREVFQNVGMFSDDYFMYAEDLDLCYKTNYAGWSNYYVGEAALIHHGGKSSSQCKADEWATIRRYASVQHFCSKTRGRSYGFAYRVAMALAAIIRLGLLAMAFPFAALSSSRRPMGRALAKWSAVLRWALGMTKAQDEATDSRLIGSEA